MYILISLIKHEYHYDYTYNLVRFAKFWSCCQWKKL